MLFVGDPGPALTCGLSRRARGGPSPEQVQRFHPHWPVDGEGQEARGCGPWGFDLTHTSHVTANEPTSHGIFLSEFCQTAFQEKATTDKFFVI